MAKQLKLVCSIGYPTAQYVDYADLPDDWDEMTPLEQDRHRNDVLTDFVSNYENHYTVIVVDGDEVDE